MGTESDALPTPDRVPGLEHIARVWATRIGTRPSTGQCFRVGICDDTGRVVSAVLCNDYREVLTLTRHAAAYGYIAQRYTDPEDRHGCDVLLGLRHS
jgi:hypothetical protein